MADIDIDPFGEHESRTEEPTDDNIPLDLVPQQEDQLGNWNVNEKRHLEVQKYFTKNT